MKKTWKIGEYAQGGVISVEINGKVISIIGKVISIIGKEWDATQGYKKSSNKSNAKEFTRVTITSDDYYAERKMFMFLTDLTTAYYADTIIEWIKSKIK